MFFLVHPPRLRSDLRGRCARTHAPARLFPQAAAPWWECGRPAPFGAVIMRHRDALCNAACIPWSCAAQCMILGSCILPSVMWWLPGCALLLGMVWPAVPPVPETSRPERRPASCLPACRPRALLPLPYPASLQVTPLPRRRRHRHRPCPRPPPRLPSELRLSARACWEAAGKLTRPACAGCAPTPQP